jgi:hypothetical protein
MGSCFKKLCRMLGGGPVELTRPEPRVRHGRFSSVRQEEYFLLTLEAQIL